MLLVTIYYVVLHAHLCSDMRYFPFLCTEHTALPSFLTVYVRQAGIPTHIFSHFGHVPFTMSTVETITKDCLMKSSRCTRDLAGNHLWHAHGTVSSPLTSMSRIIANNVTPSKYFPNLSGIHPSLTPETSISTTCMHMCYSSLFVAFHNPSLIVPAQRSS